MDSTVIGGIIRTVLAAAGGVLVTKGYVDDATLQALIGALITLGTGVWSIIAKKNAQAATTAAVTTAAATGTVPVTK